MRAIAYKSWGFIALELDPNTEEIQVVNPPMMTIVALDTEASLIFQLAKISSRLLVKVETTTLSAEGLSLPLLRVFTGSTSNQLHELQQVDWEKSTEGLYTQFTTEIRKGALGDC